MAAEGGVGVGVCVWLYRGSSPCPFQAGKAVSSGTALPGNMFNFKKSRNFLIPGEGDVHFDVPPRQVSAQSLLS